MTDEQSIHVLRDFLNTCDERLFGSHHNISNEARELLDSPTSLKRWFATRRLLPARARLNARDLVRAKSFRRLFRAVLENTDDQAAQSALNSFVASIALRTLVMRGRPRLEPTGKGIDKALGTLLVASVIAEANGRWSRLKMCADAECRWIFFDASKNRLGRWCSMRKCGNRVKTRSYRKRIGGKRNERTKQRGSLGKTV